MTSFSEEAANKYQGKGKQLSNSGLSLVSQLTQNRRYPL
jgi:hypothetical protein